MLLWSSRRITKRQHRPAEAGFFIPAHCAFGSDDIEPRAQDAPERPSECRLHVVLGEKTMTDTPQTLPGEARRVLPQRRIEEHRRPPLAAAGAPDSKGDKCPRKGHTQATGWYDFDPDPKMQG
jgi:hypothetical protein